MSHIRGRFSKAADKLVAEYTTSLPFDLRLYHQDITGVDGRYELPGGSLARLDQNFPNPFNPVTTISYFMSAASRVDLRIYDTSGRLIRVLRNAVFEGSGRHEARWDGRNDSGLLVSSGIYFCRLAVGADKETRKMVLLR